MPRRIFGFDEISLGGDLFDTSSLFNPSRDYGPPTLTNLTTQIGRGYSTPPIPKPVPPKKITKAIAPVPTNPFLLQNLQNSIRFGGNSPRENDGNLLSSIDFKDQSIFLQGPKVITPPYIPEPKPEPKPIPIPRPLPPPKVTRSNAGKSIKEELGTQNVSEEVVDVFKRAITFNVNVTDDIYVPVPDIREIEYPEYVRGADFSGTNVDFEISWNSVNTSYIRIQIENSRDFVQVGAAGTQKFNIKEIIDRYLGRARFDKDDDILDFYLNMTPYNTSGREVVKGKTERIPITFDKGDIDIPRSTAINRIADGFVSQFDLRVFDDAKYLTHLLHLGNGDNDIITTWIGRTGETPNENALILKLYEPLPTSIQPNQQVWISKLQSEPIVETLILKGYDEDYCPPLQGPNFSLEVDNGLGYQIYDELLASGSTTSTDLVNQYTKDIGIDIDKLNITYATGSDYRFDNFVHFGSAEERIKNFYYKLQTLETLTQQYSELVELDVDLGYLEAEYTPAGTSYDGYLLVQEPTASFFQIEKPTATPETRLQAARISDKINSQIRTFDGFEKFLYTKSEDEGGYPKSNGALVSSTSIEGLAWYNSSINIASQYDKSNVNYLNNNLPEHIREDYNNEDFLLFMDMIGQHFDILWVYIDSLTKSKSLNNYESTGISNQLVYEMLESLGWNTKKAFNSQYLWEYALGQYKDGTTKYSKPLKDANGDVWRRVLNNLPYLLKHKGTKRALKAAMACYGVPSSLLTIMEFGGPTDPTKNEPQKFTYEDRTAAINFKGDTSYIRADWKSVSDKYPEGIEIRISSTEAGDYDLLRVSNDPLSLDESYFKVTITNENDTYAKVNLFVSESWSGEVVSTSTPSFNFFNGDYASIFIQKSINGNNNDNEFNISVKKSKGDRIFEEVSSDTLSISNDVSWDSGSHIFIGNGFNGSVDEFRLWKNPLSEESMDNHTLLPDSIVGNSYTGSTEELYLRFDFEYPKDRTKDENSELLNVAISNAYGSSNGFMANFPSASSFPYQYTTYERVVTATVPSLGNNLSDKIRLEDIELVGDLSHNARATKKSFDRSPIDSSRLGLFFSPTKELNLDILKSFGSFNVDNFIGDPNDTYNFEYRQLKDVRDYYFDRINLNINEYINLVRTIDKSLFEILEDLSPLRAKVSKGLLIEPHLLERSKVAWKQSSAELSNNETIVDDIIPTPEMENILYNMDVDVDDDVELSVDVSKNEAIITTEDDTSLEFSIPTYDSFINYEEEISLVVDYPTYELEIDAGVGDVSIQGSSEEIVSFTQVGLDNDLVVNGGFGLYAEDGVGIVTTLDIFGNMTSSRQQIYKVKESYIETEKVQTQGWPATTGSEQVKYEFLDVTKYKYVISKVPFGNSAPSIGGNVVEVTPLNGYFPSHYRRVNNLGEGLRRSFFKGSQQTAATTPDGLEPVETFTTNPNILRVANTGRGSGEPILEVD